MVDETSLLSVARVKALRERQRLVDRRDGAAHGRLGLDALEGRKRPDDADLRKARQAGGGPGRSPWASSSPSRDPAHTQAGGRRIVENAAVQGPVVDVALEPPPFPRDGDRQHKATTRPASWRWSPPADGADAETHGGEEFSYVLAGRVKFLCEGYACAGGAGAPATASYFDACLAHRYLCADGEPCAAAVRLFAS